MPFLRWHSSSIADLNSKCSGTAGQSHATHPAASQASPGEEHYHVALCLARLQVPVSPVFHLSLCLSLCLSLSLSLSPQGSALGRILAAEEQTDITRTLAVNKLEIDSSFLSSEVNGMDNVGIWLSRLREECALFSQNPPTAHESLQGRVVRANDKQTNILQNC